MGKCSGYKTCLKYDYYMTLNYGDTYISFLLISADQTLSVPCSELM